MNQYRNHNSDEVLKSDHYLEHIRCMTEESLHGKADIAEELAWRDMQIERLTKERDHWEEEARRYCANSDHWREQLAAVTKERDELKSAFVDGYETAKNEYRPIVHKLEDQLAACQRDAERPIRSALAESVEQEPYIEGYRFSRMTPFGNVVWDIGHAVHPDAIEWYPVVKLTHPAPAVPDEWKNALICMAGWTKDYARKMNWTRENAALIWQGIDNADKLLDAACPDVGELVPK